MQSELFDYLKNTVEYKEFKKISKSRSILAIIIIFFGLIILAATDLNSIDEFSMIYFGILSIVTVFLIKYMYGAFFKKPIIIMRGTIGDIREKRRIVHEEDMLQSRVSYQYLIHGENTEYWGDCIFDFIEGRAKKHNIGEQVIFFSMSPGDGYIIENK